MIRCVLFDVAGTLVHVAEPVGATYARIARRHGIDVDPLAIERGFRAAYASAPPLAFPGLHGSAVREREIAWWRRLVDAAFASCGVVAHPALDAAFVEMFGHFAAPSAWRVYDDVVPALEQLREREIRLAVVSNFDGRLHPLLEGMGLASFFDVVVASSEHGAAKPDPAIFHVALRACGCEPRQALHVGDSVDLDLRAAQAAGIAALRIDRDAAPDDETIRTLLDLRPRVERGFVR